MKSIVKKIVVVSAFGVGISAMGGEQAEAATSTANMTVQTLVDSNCEITATALTFNDYDPASATNLDTAAGGGTAGALSVDCTLNVNFAVQLDDGVNPGAGASGAWAMAGSGTAAGSFLGYDLNYGGAAITAGADFASDTGDGYSGLGAGLQVYTIDGTITAGQSVAGGNYADTVVATLTY